MHEPSDMNGQFEGANPERHLEQEQKKADQYQPAHFVFQGAVMSVSCELGVEAEPRRCVVTYGSGQGWKCSCKVFHDHEICRHLLALERMLSSFPTLQLHDLGGKSEG